MNSVIRGLEVGLIMQIIIVKSLMPAISPFLSKDNSENSILIELCIKS